VEKQLDNLLFGGTASWKLDEWQTVDDRCNLQLCLNVIFRIRGGASHSYLALNPQNTLRFFGILDKTTLGGAGFASQKYHFQDPSPFTTSDGIVLAINKGDTMRYSLNLISPNDVSGVTYKVLYKVAHIGLISMIVFFYW
jgi:hypothetical protein